jgi:hypothetical protein
VSEEHLKGPSISLSLRLQLFSTKIGSEVIVPLIFIVIPIVILIYIIIVFLLLLFPIFVIVTVIPITIVTLLLLLFNNDVGLH